MDGIAQITLEELVALTPLDHVIHALFPLPVLALVLWWIRGRSNPDTAWNTRIDLGMALTAGLGVALLSSLWMPRFFLSVAPLAASDFGQYCENVGLLRNGTVEGWIMQRSMAAGLLPSLLARGLGIMDGLFLASTLSVGALGAACFLWARALHSRIAGLVAASLVCSVAPLVVLSRTVTFYPEVIASYMMCGATTALAVRFRTLPAVLASAVAIGWVLVVDVRGLIWALPALVLVGAATWLLNTRRKRWMGTGMILGCLVLSFLVGRVTQWGHPPSLEQHAVFYVDEALRRATPTDRTAGVQISVEEFPYRYVWGHTSPHNIPRTLAKLWTLNGLMPAAVAALPENKLHRETQLLPWMGPALFGLACATWALRRRRWLLMGMFVGLAPFAMALKTAATAVAHARYAATGIAVIPVILGVGFAALYLGSLSDKDHEPSTPALSLRDALAVSLIGLLVLGTIPTWLSPSARWRLPISADVEPAKTLWHASQDAPLPPQVNGQCVDALRGDFREGLPVGSRLLGWTVDTPTVDTLP